MNNFTNNKSFFCIGIDLWPEMYIATAYLFAQCFTMIANTVHPMLKINQSSIIFHDCNLVTLLMNIFQEISYHGKALSKKICLTGTPQLMQDKDNILFRVGRPTTKHNEQLMNMTLCTLAIGLSQCKKVICCL
jgi:hypothetical protein